MINKNLEMALNLARCSSSLGFNIKGGVRGSRLAPCEFEGEWRKI